MSVRLNQALLENPSYQALWDKVLEGFKYISGSGWEDRANYEHFWPLVEHLYKLAYGQDAELPEAFRGPLVFMFSGHLGRFRKGIRARPYFHHVLMILYLAWLARLPLNQQLAAVNHDDVEDVPKHYGVIEEWVVRQISFQLPPESLRTVNNLTNKKHPGGKHAGQLEKMSQIPWEDASLKLLDRTGNLYDMRQDKPKGFTPSRIEEECINALELAAAMPVAAPPQVLALLHHAIALLLEENDLLPA